MPVQRVGPDGNGLYYNAIPTSEWAAGNPIGEGLRAQGYRYCGFGTWGIYIAAAGQPCWEKATSSQPPPPNILPPAPQESLAPAGSVTDKACGSCRKTMATPTVSAPAPSAPSPTTPGASAPLQRKGFPWWLLILLLIAAKVMTDDRKHT